MKQAISYLRVSTDRQGLSGLGLEAQQQAVKQFAAANGYALIGEIIEVESGKKNNRPLLQVALKQCEEKGATLLIAKLDRLARSVVFIGKLMESKIRFIAIDNPFATDLILHVTAAFAEHERKEISKRTIAALQAAKQRGVRLGSFGRDVLAERNKERSHAFALALLPTIRFLQQSGHTTVRSLASELNRLRVPTFRNTGQKWHISTVHKLIRQIDSHPYARPIVQALPANLSPS